MVIATDRAVPDTAQGELRAVPGIVSVAAVSA
jgi:hypothetical protein